MDDCAAVGVDHVLCFGKHKGKRVAEVIGLEPSYLRWAAGEGVITLAPAVAKVVLALCEDQDRHRREECEPDLHDDWGNRD